MELAAPGRRLVDPTEEECEFTMEANLLPEYAFKPFLNSKTGQDGKSFCFPIHPLLEVCGSITMHAVLKTNIRGSLCLEKRSVGVTLVFQAAVVGLRASNEAEMRNRLRDAEEAHTRRTEPHNSAQSSGAARG